MTLAGVGLLVASKLKAVAAELGWGVGALYLLDRLGQALGGAFRLHCYALVAQAVPDRPLLPPGRGRSLAVRTLTEDDLGDRAFPLSPDQLRARLAQGSVCFGAFEGSALVGYQCLTPGPHADELICARFDPQPAGRTAWDYDIFLLAEQRTGFAFARLWDGAFTWMRARSITWTLSYISLYNRISVHSHRRMGARTVGHLVVLSCAGRELLVCDAPWRVFWGSRRRRPSIPVVAPG